MIDIYGDSFADPNWDSEDSFVWHKRLGEVNNFAKSGVGPHYSFKELYKRYKNYTKDDHVIFIISGRDRINFHVPDEYKNQGIRPEDIFWNAGKTRITQMPAKHCAAAIRTSEWYALYKSHMEYTCKTFKAEIDNMTAKCESFLYMISRLQQCKVTVFLLHDNDSYMGDRLNDDLFYLHNYGLLSASNEEFIEFDANRFPRWELRQNHFSRENHDIMEEIIQTRTFKPFKKNFVDPAPFEQDEERFIYE